MKDILLPVAIISICITALHCGIIENDVSNFGRSRNETGTWKRKDNGKPGESPEINVRGDTIVYLTTVEYENGYHWQQDADGENAPFTINVYRNDDKILEVNGGPGTTIASHPDMHRFANGHLYTDYSTINETIISQDGQELFRYKGREMICGFLAREDGIYTLGQNRNGKGLTFRRNGETLYSNDSGIVLGDISNPCGDSGALYEANGDIVFMFNIITKYDGGDIHSLYIVRNGIQQQVETNRNINGIYDARLIDGVIYIAGNLKYNDGNPVLSFGNELVKYGSGISNVQNCRILWTGTDVFLKADFINDPGRSRTSFLWDSNGKHITRLPSGTWVYDFYVEGESYAYVYTEGDMTGSLFVSVHAGTEDGRHSLAANGKYKFMSSSCAALKNSIFCIGLSSATEGGHSLLIVNSETRALEINGFISSVDVEITG